MIKKGWQACAIWLGLVGILMAPAPAVAEAQAHPAVELSEESDSSRGGVTADDSSRGNSMDESKPSFHGLHQIGRDARYLVTRPFHLDRKGTLKLVGVGATAGLLYLSRNRIRDWAQNHRSDSGDRFLDSARTMGKGAFAPSLALIFYGLSFHTRDEREKETAVLLLESMGYSALGVGMGRFVLATDRPNVGTEVNYFRSNGHGFSGDAALAASVVNPLRCQYLRIREGDGKGRRFWKRLATGALYTGAGLTAYQRVNQDRHWAPDAFLGMATGLAVGGALCDSHSISRKEMNSWNLEPSLGGFTLRVSF